MADQKIVCSTCRKEFLYTEKEKKFLEDLVEQKKLPEVKEPRRCLDCRGKSRRGTLKASPGPAIASSIPLRVAPPPPSPPPPPPPVSVAPASVAAPVQAPASVPAKGAAFQEEVDGDVSDRILDASPTSGRVVQDSDECRLVMVAADFEKLVCRDEVVLFQGNRKVTLRLADIGLPAMKTAMEKAVLKWWKS